MKNMAVYPNFTLEFKKKEESLVDIAKRLLQVIGTILLFANSVVGKNPLLLTMGKEREVSLTDEFIEELLGRCQAVIGINRELFEGYIERLMAQLQFSEFKEHIRSCRPIAMSCMGAEGTEGILKAEEVSESEICDIQRALMLYEYRIRLSKYGAAFERYLTKEQLERLGPIKGVWEIADDDLEKYASRLRRCNQAIRKFRTIEDLRRYQGFLLSVIGSIGGPHQPKISSTDKNLFYFETASGRGWFAIQMAEGAYVVHGEADFVAYPEVAIKTLKSQGYQFELGVRLTRTIEQFEQYLAKTTGGAFEKEVHPDGSISFEYTSNNRHTRIVLERSEKAWRVREGGVIEATEHLESFDGRLGRKVF